MPYAVTLLQPSTATESVVVSWWLFNTNVTTFPLLDSTRHMPAHHVKPFVASGFGAERSDDSEDVERDGSTLFGHTAGPGATDWEAEIRDERPEESFAWRSVAGTDCAGLVTFHELSERLTRIELDLDVLPRRPGEVLSLSLHLARHAPLAQQPRSIGPPAGTIK